MTRGWALKAAAAAALVVGWLLLLAPAPAPERRCVAGMTKFGDIDPATYAACSYRWDNPKPQFVEGVQTISMIKTPKSFLPAPALLAEWAERSGNDRQYLLIFNECEEPQQCDTDPDTAARFLRFVEDKYNPAGFRLIVGGSIMWSGGRDWMNEFMEAYRARFRVYPRVAGFHFHLYADTQPTPAAMAAALVRQLDNVRVFLGQYGDPGGQVWITEFGCLWRTTCTEEYTAELLRLMTECFDRVGCGAFVDRAFWFTAGEDRWPQTSLVDAAGDWTAAGRAWRDWRPKPARSLRRVFLPLAMIPGDLGIIHPDDRDNCTPPFFDCIGFSFPGP